MSVKHRADCECALPATTRTQIRNATSIRVEVEQPVRSTACRATIDDPATVAATNSAGIQP
ncbi:hypothetical protein A5767_03115 [Rhodococcus sp. 852002-51564_SCH6189132-a]|nr:hypothetical protein A5767_03115 [Rhodococcus sp. 852002-51564_SCH6189132-a]